ncbi:exopolysaccharide transport family protein [Chitinophaga solisilvae]|uniref:exopolysaccharide transport family protein n=1 Tax=Chitinophaga solisilvae TaxID=1233460 RepID=UPI00136D6AB0|nr:hypothetical protein [Chitinophaga solisilvae]
MDVIYFVKALYKKKWWILAGSVAAVVIAFVLTMGRPRLYVSNAQFSTGFTMKDQITLRDENTPMYEADVKFDNTIQTLNSPLVISLLAYNMVIHDLSSNKPFARLTEKQMKSDAYRQFNKTEALELCRRKLDSMQMLSAYIPEETRLMDYLKLCGYDYESIRKTLNINRLQRTDYIDITFRSPNAEESAYVVNALYKEFIRYYRSLRSERSVENIETFDDLVHQKKQELDKKVEALRMYKSSEGLLNVEAASGNELGLISSLEKTLLEEQANNNTLSASLESVNGQLSMVSSGKTVYDNGNGDIVNIRRQINQANDDNLRAGGNDPQIQEKLKDLRKKYQDAISSSSTVSGKGISKDELLQKKSALTAQLSASTQNIENMRAKIRSLKGSVGTYANKEATVSVLQQEVTLAQEEYNKLKEKLNAAMDNRTAAVDNFRQTLVGMPSFKPESSKRLAIMMMAGIAVFIMTTLGILLMEFFDSSIKSPSVFERNVDLKLISTINHAALHKNNIENVLHKKIEDNEVVRKRQNTFRELLRKLRYELENSGKSIFLFTSTEPQQGKTTLVQAVAYSLSLSNKRVLIIDTNFCNNDLTVQLEAKPTLESFSIEPDKFSIDKVREIVTTYSANGIEVIGCRGGDYTPNEILPKNHLLNYLPQLTAYYDFILMEGAPLNEYTDSKELEAYAEGVIAVFSSKASVKQIDKDSVSFLQSLNGKLLGAVLNNVNEDFLEL